MHYDINRPDGRRYEGLWANGKQNGKGMFTNKQGETIEGEWKDGKKVSAAPTDTVSPAKTAGAKKAAPKAPASNRKK